MLGPLEAEHRFLVRCSFHDFNERRINTTFTQRLKRQRLVKMLFAKLFRRTGERQAAGQQLEGHDPEGIDVAL